MISVIIPTYKSPEALDLCLRSAIEGQFSKNQIIVVVDGFYELNKQILDKWKDHIDILNLEENVGLCRGTNLGVYNARYDNILIVNDDNVFPNKWDLLLKNINTKDSVVTPNQIEPSQSMFKQFIIKDLGKHPRDFNLEKFWEFERSVTSNISDKSGSTLPIYMSKINYLRVGGWDENYQLGMVADWDFFLKCQLSGMRMIRTYVCNFYHFVSLTTLTPEKQQERIDCETNGHNYAKYKWGNYIKHDVNTNLKYV
jgi:glycosyltransferase involved in cell wall biosynthesis